MDLISLIKRNAITNIQLAEDLVFAKLSAEFGSHLKRDVKSSWSNATITYDGLIIKDNSFKVIEIKCLTNCICDFLYPRVKLIQNSLCTIKGTVNTINTSLLLVLVTEKKSDATDAIKNIVERITGQIDFPIEVRYYNLEELKKDSAI